MSKYNTRDGITCPFVGHNDYIVTVWSDAECKLTKKMRQRPDKVDSLGYWCL